MRAKLPPNLTRHYWEARRTYLSTVGQTDGYPMTPWFRLTPTERLVVEKEVELLRQAIRTAEEEQDLVAALNARTAAPADSAPAAEAPAEEQPSTSQPTRGYPVTGKARMYVSSDPTAPIRYEVVLSPLSDRATLDKKPPQEDCQCLGCSAVAAFLKLTTAAVKSTVPAGRPSEGEFAARNAALIEQIGRARSSGHKYAAEHALRQESGSGAAEGSAGPDQPAAAPKPTTVTEALAKQGPPKWAPGTIGSGPVQLAFGTPLLSSDKLSQEVWKIVVAEIRRQNLRNSLLRGMVSLA
ncbi:hypothetical protein [Streptomyces griseus]|uniref:hypothetical protein n=1 Tax=Streptomyces griseus TaxID=1911 RepID=UPI0037A45F14